MAHEFLPDFRSIARIGRAAIVGALLVAGCGLRSPGEDKGDQKVASTAQAVTATASISGQARDAHGAPLPNVAVALVGPTPGATITDSHGNYSFTQLAPGAYVATPAFLGCGFVPAIASLANVNGSVTQNFDGSGLTCGGAPAARIVISGVLNDANGLPLPGVAVALTGGALASTTTDASGHYAFPPVVPGSFHVTPTLTGCSFLPQSADLDNVTDNLSQFFSGSGSTCGGAFSVNAGATTGPFAIRGHVRDSSGTPIVGARIALSGAAQAVRFSDLSGGYTFHVSTGVYTVQASGECPLNPSSTLLTVLADTTQDFAATAGGCATSAAPNVSPSGSMFLVKQGGTLLGYTMTYVMHFASATAAAARMQRIAAEKSTPPRSLTIAGFPALERQVTVALEDPDAPGGANAGTGIALTTAIQVGSTVVRFQDELASDASQATITRFFAAGRNFTADQLSALTRVTTQPVLAKRTNAPVVAGRIPSQPDTAGVLPADPTALVTGELQVAASNNENNVVYGAQQGQIFVSTDSGQTLARANALAPTGGRTAHGDPSVAVGAVDAFGHQRFYFSEADLLGLPPNDLDSAQVYRSSEDSVTGTVDLTTFSPTGSPSAAPAVPCIGTDAGGTCKTADQAQIVADRYSQVVTSNGSRDRLYMVWRNFVKVPGVATIGIICSSDGGDTWSAQNLSAITDDGADRARITVGGDGSVYLVYSYPDTTTTGNEIVAVQKFPPCDTSTGFAPEFSSSATVSSLTPVPPLPGVVRTPHANYMIAADDSDVNNNRVFVTFATSNTSGGEDVEVVESTDGAQTWAAFGTTNFKVMNSAPGGHRYFPWICSSNGIEYVTWYDRRDSFSVLPDLTAYYRASFSVDASGILTGPIAEVNVSGIDDAQCQAGYFNAPRDSTDEEALCTDLPPGNMQVGECHNSKGACPSTPCELCDFRTGFSCSGSGTTCSLRTAGTNGARTIPTYGDYNGAACAQGKLFMAWVATQPPAGATCMPNGYACGSDLVSCCSGNCVSGVCSPSTSACVADFEPCTVGGTACCTGSSISVVGGGTALDHCQGGVCLPTLAIYTGNECSGDSGCRATAAPTKCNGTIVDLTTDTSNCGACGVTCSGTCKFGHCTIAIATGQTGTTGIAVDSSNIYWANTGHANTQNGEIISAPIGGGTLSTLVSDFSFEPEEIAVDTKSTGSVFWTDIGQEHVFSVAKSGGGTPTMVDTETLPSGFHFVGGVALGNGNVYWTQSPYVFSVAESGGTVTTMATGTQPIGIAVDSKNVYWGDSLAGTNTNGTVNQIPVGGGSKVTLATGQTPFGIAIDSTTVYWANDAFPGSVMAAPIGGGLARLLAQSPPNSGTITVATDGTNVYFNGVDSSGSDALLRVSKDGGQAVPIASPNDSVTRIAVDGTNVYWTDSATGAVYQTNK
jgi:hypothetical protein